eukprot:scaffold48834_cov91-Phaeocystis_antarctica.AAC.1
MRNGKNGRNVVKICEIVSVTQLEQSERVLKQNARAAENTEPAEKVKDEDVKDVVAGQTKPIQDGR